MPKVIVYPADLGGCGHYRLIWPGRALQAQGADVDVVLPGDAEDRQIQAQWWSRAGQLEVVDVLAPEADIVVLQRPLSRYMAAAVPRLQAKGVRVVVELDDDFDAVHPRNVAWRSVQPHLSPDRNVEHLRSAAAQADMVIASTPAIAGRYGRHGRVRVVRNRIPARYLDVTREAHDETFVGWSGSTETHPFDLQACGSAVVRSLRPTGAKMAVVGTGKGVQRALGLDEAPRACGWRPIVEYPEALGQFDVGIVPLELSAFNEAKSYLKGLEMAATGVPFIASPTGEYRRFHDEGAGLLAAKPREWERHLKTLIGSEDARAELAGRGREIAARHTVQGNAGDWWDAWCAALDREEIRCA